MVTGWQKPLVNKIVGTIAIGTKVFAESITGKLPLGAHSPLSSEIPRIIPGKTARRR